MSVWYGTKLGLKARYLDIETAAETTVLCAVGVGYSVDFAPESVLLVAENAPVRPEHPQQILAGQRNSRRLLAPSG